MVNIVISLFAIWSAFSWKSFAQLFTEGCSWGTSWQSANISSSNDFAPTNHFWTNDKTVHWCMSWNTVIANLFHAQCAWVGRCLSCSKMLHSETRIFVSIPGPFHGHWYLGSLFHQVISSYGNDYHQTSNIRCTLVGDKIVNHSGVVGASPVGTAPTTSSFSTCLQWIRQRQLQDETKNISVLGFGATYIRGLIVSRINVLLSSMKMDINYPFHASGE